jgi:hypothetical protein
MRYGLTLLLLLINITGCGALALDNTEATLVSQNINYATEAAQIRGTLQAEETQVMGTAVAGETLVAVENNVNAVLLATVRAGDPPTVQVRAQTDRSIGRTPGPINPVAGPGGQVIETYTTTEVRASDGCGVDRTTAFAEGTLRLFAVQEVTAIPADTVVGIEWYFDGGLAFEDQLRVTEFADRLCLWFFLEPYSTGDWSVQFTSNGTLVGQRVNFRVGE